MEERTAELRELTAGAGEVRSSCRSKNPDTDAGKAQEYLERCRDRQKKAEFLEDQIKELEAISEYSSPHLTGAGGGGVSDRVGALGAKIADMRDILDRERTACLEERARSLILISQLPDCRLAEVLTQRYIKGKSWSVISGEMHIAETWLYKLHTKGLNAFWQLFGDSIERGEGLI
ncbi:MAG: hypothetical protein NC203_02920 [Firmicutes bacterium]|nr:hypothetical protein [[Eubacterium] siraeum]MCM1487296.1 hypothetical protein [Bacillota bacterium]